MPDRKNVEENENLAGSLAHLRSGLLSVSWALSAINRSDDSFSARERFELNEGFSFQLGLLADALLKVYEKVCPS